RIDQPRPGDGVDVPGEGEGDHVGLDADDHRARLLAGAAVGLANRQFLYRALLPLLGEEAVEHHVRLTGGIVGDVEEGDLAGEPLLRGLAPAASRAAGQGYREDAAHEGDPGESHGHLRAARAARSKWSP